MRRYYRRNIMIQGPTQDMPTWDGRVELDPKVKDHWGIPVLRISGDKHPHTSEIANRQAERAEAWLKEAGAVVTYQRRAGRGAQRPPAPVGHLPHGERPEDARSSTRPAASTTCPTSS